MPDRVPRFEIWIDLPPSALGVSDPCAAYVEMGQDCVMLPSVTPTGSNAWRNGIDEWGRIWQGGIYADGAVDDEGDLARYTPPLSYVDQLFDPIQARQTRASYPDHCLIYGTHVGPFTAAYMAMGFARFFTCLYDDPRFVHRVLEARTAWCIALYQKAIDLGAEVVVLGDDVAHQSGPMIAPAMWRQEILAYHRRIVEALNVPVIWHSDGDIEPLLPMAIEAGFIGVHGLEPAAGVDLSRVKRTFGRDLVLIGNVDVGVLCRPDRAAVRHEIDRCVVQGAPGGGFMVATCNSIFDGMDRSAVLEMFRYERQIGRYE
jgi:uroporphyrinogen decarboxylase